MNLAIISPLENAYSETFIQAHKKIPGVRVFYYYGMSNFLHLEGYGALGSSNSKYWYNLQRKFKGKPYPFLYKKLLKRSFKKNKIDVVLAEYGPTASDHLPAIREMNLPLVVHFHGYDATRKGALKIYDNYKEVFSYASYVIGVSRKMVEQLINIGCPREKVIYNVCGPDPLFSEVQAKFLKKQFIAVGRFVDKKAPYLTILAFKQVLKVIPDAKLVMAGNGPLLNACQNIVKLNGLEKNVEFLGVISPQKYRELLAESFAFVQHSLTADDGDSEGTPVSILEASAAGLPVISTRHAGIPDVINHDKSGLLTEEMDVSGMAKYMITLLNDRSYAMQLGANGRKNIIENFTLDRHLEMLQKIIVKAVKEFS